jgi:hypothetical protein
VRWPVVIGDSEKDKIGYASPLWGFRRKWRLLLTVYKAGANVL